MSRLLTAAVYKFVELPDFAKLQAPLLTLCHENQVNGTILLAPEGINGTIAGAPDTVQAVLTWLRSHPQFADLEHKESWAVKSPFYRMKVRLKAEIVAMRVEGINPSRMAGQYVPAQQWNTLISDPKVVLIDARNHYEVAIGSFRGAINPRTSNFSDLPAWIEEQCQPGGALAATQAGRPRVAMYCTGGIRCEKSTAFLRMRGFDEVYHLKGGILKYLETVPQAQSLWQGECFVFDERVSLGHGLGQGDMELCRSCRRPLSQTDRLAPTYESGVSCPACFDIRSPIQKRRFAERQRQLVLARTRDQVHVGARMPANAGPAPRDGRPT